MADSRAAADPYTTTFQSTVDRLDGRELVLSETYFYPEGGGQPADRGTVAGTDVVDVRHTDGGVVHVLAESPAIEPGESVTGAVDSDFRTYCMRAHTASHVLYGAGRRLFDDLGYGGFDISPEKVRVDFATPTDVDDEALVELERLVNRTVWEDRGVSWETRHAADALADDDIAFNTKTEEGIDGETVRIVTVEDWDVAACGGTHVASTGEIGPVSVLDRSNPGEGLTRIEFAVGPAGIRHRIEEKRAALDAAAAAGTAVAELPGEVDRLTGQVAELEDVVSDLKARVAATRIDALRDDLVERNGARWLVGAIDGLDVGVLGEQAKATVGDDLDVVALVGRDGGTVIAVAADGVDAGGIVEDVTDEFGGGGGGSPAFAQGGGIDAPPERVVEYLRQR